MKDKKFVVRMLNGYRVIKYENHPKAMTSDNWKGFIYEHILKAEIMMNRSLKDNEEVHHLNGNRSDNSIENLIVLEKSQHTKLHNWLSNCALICESDEMKAVNSEEPKARFCSMCGIHLDRTQKSYCSRSCFRKSKRKVENRPELEQIQLLIDNGMSMCEIGRKFGVSDNAVRKWIKSATATLIQAQ